ncbi:hypothetical protein M0802_010696 [Mischocyttarus mexicanus]|nr:hypothetical protein M0802_010696 [Mischocyttarus mexicanus]
MTDRDVFGGGWWGRWDTGSGKKVEGLGWKKVVDMQRRKAPNEPIVICSFDPLEFTLTIAIILVHYQDS